MSERAKEFRGSFRAERLDQWVTVYRSEATNEIVGSLIKGICILMQRQKTQSVRDADLRGADLRMAD